MIVYASQESRLEVFEDLKNMVPSIAKKFFSSFIESGFGDDIVAQGYLELWNCICKYENKGAKISTYAYSNIYWAMKYHLVSLGVCKMDRSKHSEQKFSYINDYSLEYEYEKKNDSKRAITLEDKLSYDDLNFDNVDLQNLVNYLCNVFKEKSKIDRCYIGCDVILNLYLEEPTIRKKDIIDKLGYDYRSLERRLKRIRYEIETFYQEVI